MTSVLIDMRDHVCSEVDDLLEILRCEIEQVTQAARYTLEVPDVRHRGGEFDVAHTLAAHLRACDFHATSLANDALEADPLVLAAIAFPVARGAEDLLTEEAVAFGLQGAVVDGLRLFDFAVGPATNVVSSGKANLQLIKEVDVKHECLLSFSD